MIKEVLNRLAVIAGLDEDTEECVEIEESRGLSEENFKALTPTQQIKYIKEHPTSKYGKDPKWLRRAKMLKTRMGKAKNYLKANPMSKLAPKKKKKTPKGIALGVPPHEVSRKPAGNKKLISDTIKKIKSFKPTSKQINDGKKSAEWYEDHQRHGYGYHFTGKDRAFAENLFKEYTKLDSKLDPDDDTMGVAAIEALRPMLNRLSEGKLDAFRSILEEENWHTALDEV